jgi:hypothetical protein
VAVNQAELNQITSTQQLALVPGYTSTTNGLDSRKLSFHNQTLWSSGVLADSFRGGLKRDLSLAFEMDDYDFDNSDFGSGAKGGSVAEVTAKTKGGAVTEFYDTTLVAPALRNSAFPELGGNTNTAPTVSSTSPTDPKPRVWVPMYEAGNNNPGRALTSGTNYFPWSPVFIREDSVAKKRFVGPLWHVIRDYYRLYKEIDWSSDVATLPARSFFPNNSQFISGKYKTLSNGVGGSKELYDPYDYESAYAPGPYGTSSSGAAGGGNSTTAGKVYPGANHAGDSLGTLNPVIGKDKSGGSIGFIPRVTRSAYMPNLHRVIMVFSLKRKVASIATTTGTITGSQIYMICTPVVVLHNPYNTKLKLQSSPNETDVNIKGSAMRVSFSGIEQINIQCQDRTYTGGATKKWTMTTWMAANNRYARSILNCRKYTSTGVDISNGEYENLVMTIPPTTLEPGEFAVFSSKKLLDNNSSEYGQYGSLGGSQLSRASDDSQVWILPLEKGYWYTGGFYGQLPWYTSDLSAGFVPGSYADNDDLTFGLRIGRGGSGWSANGFGYWKCWTNMVSGWKGNKSGAIDEVNSDTTLEPGYLEQLGSSKYTGKAGLGQTVFVGSWAASPDDNFYGNAGWPASGAGTGTGIIIQKAGMLNLITDTAKPGHVFGVIDTRMRVADTVRDTPDASTTYRNNCVFVKAQNVPAAHPAWLFTNPIAPYSSNLPLGGLPAIGNASLRTQIYGPDQLGVGGASNDWGFILRNDYTFADGTRALGGISHEAQGANSVIEIEIPQTAPLSIGQLMHANVSTSDLFPYRTVGNSFPNTVVPLDKSWTYGTPYTVTQYTGGATFADMSYLMNNALWDNFFFSGAAPVLKSGKTGNYNSVRNLKAQDVLNNFANGTGKLANPSLRLYQPFGISDAVYAFGFTGDIATPAFLNTADRNVTTIAPDGWKKMSSYLLNDGAFNVNSTSVEAWTALYASIKGLSIGTGATSTSNARFPRIIGPTGQDVITLSDLKKSSYWNGFINLSDKQIVELAKATVAEVKARAKFFYRTERDQDYTPLTRRFLGFPAAQEPATPLLGMGEFINRFLGPTKKFSADITYSLYPLPTSATSNTGAAYPDNFPAPASTAAASPDKYKWMIRSGVLESAIARADKTLGTATLASTPSNGAIIDPAVSHNWKNGSGTNGGSTGMPPGVFWRNVEVLTPEDNTNRTHNGFGAAGCLFQGDLLQALGPRLATRSDTFTIRAYGEATDDSGANANCVIELVVQRTPEYLDNNTQPHERIEDLKSTNVSKAVNSLLGRRFIIISARWLAKSEI